MVKKDCFAYSEDSPYEIKCTVLQNMVCEKKDCPFYKTQKEFEEGCSQYGIESQNSIAKLSPATLKFYNKQQHLKRG